MVRSRIVWSLISTIAVAQPAAAVTIGVTSLSAVPNSSINVCFSMTGGAGQVAGLQLDANWDTNCLNAELSQGDKVQCDVNVQKTLQTKKMPAGNSFRALLFSLQDTDPIANDGELFCCAFTVREAASSKSCSINLGNVITSDSKGNRLNTTPTGGIISVQVSGSGLGDRGGSMGGAGINPGAVTIPGAQAPAPVVPAAPAPQAAPAVGGVAPVAPAAPAAPKAAAPAAAGALGGLPAAVQQGMGNMQQGLENAAAAAAATAGITPVATPVTTPAAKTSGTPGKKTPEAGKTGTPKTEPTAKETPKPQGTPTAPKGGTPTAVEK